jgi:hypothetical protein
MHKAQPADLTLCACPLQQLCIAAHSSICAAQDSVLISNACCCHLFVKPICLVCFIRFKVSDVQSSGRVRLMITLRVLPHSNINMLCNSVTSHSACCVSKPWQQLHQPVQLHHQVQHASRDTAHSKQFKKLCGNTATTNASSADRAADTVLAYAGLVRQVACKAASQTHAAHTPQCTSSSIS